jgi:acyl-CoA thioester hydrolase
MTHAIDLRVYYEDTDLAGVVYYANYLKFIERGRSEWVRALGVDQASLRATQGIVFAVRRIEADYLRPARFDDILRVTTEAESLTPARITLVQHVLRDGAMLFTARVVLVCIGPDGRARRLPEAMRRILATQTQKSAG